MYYSFVRRVLFSFLALFAVASLSADTAVMPATPAVAPTAQSGDLRVQVEVQEAEMSSLGISKDSIETDLCKQLSNNAIIVTNDLTKPLLVLRIKSVVTQNIVATFIQLAFFEDATLMRGNNKIQAMTWSQASLITTSKAEMLSETVKALNAMIQLFTKDFQAAFGSRKQVTTTPQTTPAAPSEMPIGVPASQPAPAMPMQTPQSAEAPMPTSEQATSTPATSNQMPETAPLPTEQAQHLLPEQAHSCT